MYSLDDNNIAYLKTSKWNIEGSIIVENTLYEKAYGEANVNFDEENEQILIYRTFSTTIDDEVYFFEFDEHISKSVGENNVLRYTVNTPIAPDPLKGLYVISFDDIHVMYAQKIGGFSAQEIFMLQEDKNYINNGFMFKNGKLHLRWNFLFKQINNNQA